MNRMTSFLLAHALTGGAIGPNFVDGGEPDGATKRRREMYRSFPPGKHLMQVTKVEMESQRVLVRGKRLSTNPLEVERFARAEAKRARKAAKNRTPKCEVCRGTGCDPSNVFRDPTTGAPEPGPCEACREVDYQDYDERFNVR